MADVFYNVVVPAIGITLGFGIATVYLRKSEERFPISASVAQVDLGTVEEGSVVDRAVTIKNDSSTPFKIDKISTSCGCTSVSKLAVLSPHGYVPLMIRYNSSGRLGNIKQFVMLQSGNKTLSVPIVGNVVRNYQVSHSQIVLSNDRESTVTVSRRDGKPFEIPNVETPRGVFASINRVASSTVQVQFRLDSTPGKTTVGHYIEEAKVSIAGDLPTTLAIPTTWSMPSHYKIAPSLVNFGAVEPGRLLKRTITLNGAGASRLKIATAPRGWSVTLSPASANRAILTVSGTVKDTIFQDKVLLATGNAPEPLLRVPIVAALDTTSGATCSAP